MSETPMLTVGMATYDDYDGVYFTVNSVRLYHPEVLDRVNFLVVDNNPAGRAGKALETLADRTPGMRYVPVDDVRGTWVKDRVFREADTDWVLCVDSHVQFGPGALAKLLDYLVANPHSRDLLQGPVLYPRMEYAATHLDPVWRRGQFGIWGRDPRGQDADSAPFEIGMQGMGAFCCRRDVWPGFNPRFRDRGAEEGYIHKKFRAAGHRTLCLPFLRWTHRFTADSITPPYPAAKELTFRNYLIGWEETGLDTAPVIEHFKEWHDPGTVKEWLSSYARERANPFTYFDAIFCVNQDQHTSRWARSVKRFEQLGFGHRLRRLPAVRTPGDHHVGCALSHRNAIEKAEREGVESVLVLEDDVVFLTGTPWILRRSLRELRQRDWDLFYLGGWHLTRGDSHPTKYAARPLSTVTVDPVDGCAHLEPAKGTTTTHAVAYHRRVFRRLLDELPSDEPGMRRWIAEHTAIDVYLAETFSGQAFRCAPIVASQEDLVNKEDPELRDQFLLGPVEEDQRTPPERTPIQRRDDSVAVIIPVRDGAKYIDQALASVATQTVPADEVIVVDDASGDDSYERASAWADRLPLSVIRLPRHAGTWVARRRAIAAASASLIAQLDADDMFLPEHIAVMKHACRQTPGLIAPRRLALTGDSAGLPQPLREHLPEPADQLTQLLLGNYVGIGCLFRRKDYEEAGGYRECRYAEDWDLWLRFAQAGVPIAKPEAATYVYRWHPDNISSKVDRTVTDLEIIGKFLDGCEDAGHRKVAKLSALQRAGYGYLSTLARIPAEQAPDAGITGNEDVELYADADLGHLILGGPTPSGRRPLVIIPREKRQSPQITLRGTITATGTLEVELLDQAFRRR